MANTNRVTIVIDADGRAFIEGMNRASGSVDRLDSKTGKLGKTMGTALKWGAVAATAALAGVTYGLVKAIQEADAAERSTAMLAATLRSTGGAAGLAMSELQALAGEMQRTTTFGDDAVESAESLMLTFTKIGRETFPTAIRLAADMSVGMGQDLKSSVIQLGKALNDPVLGVTALQRVGVQLSETQKKQIEDFMAVNDIASAQKVILGELATQFGGQAAAQAETFGGKLSQLKNASGDLQEEIGFIITKNSFFVKGIDIARQYLERAAHWVNNHQLALMNLAKNGIVTVITILGKAVEVMRFFHNGWLGIKIVGNAAAIVLADSLRVIFEGLRMLLFPLDLIFKGLVALGKIKTNPFDNFRAGLEQFQLSSRDVMADTLKEIDEVNGRYDRWGQTVNGIVEGLKNIKVEQTKLKDIAPQPGAGVDTGIGDIITQKERLKAEDELKALEKDNPYKAQGQDPFSEAWLQYEPKLQALQEYNTRVLQAMVTKGEGEAAIEQRYSELKMQYAAKERDFKLQAASETFGMMSNMMQNLTVLTGKEGGAAFQAMKAFAAAQTAIDTYKAAQGAYAALAGIPVVGPALGSAAAAAAIVAGMARVRQIQSMQPGGSATGSTISAGGAANPAYSGGSPGAYPVPTRTEEKAEPKFEVNIYNPMGNEDWDDLAEHRIIPALNRAYDRAVPIKGTN